MENHPSPNPQHIPSPNESYIVKVYSPVGRGKNASTYGYCPCSGADPATIALLGWIALLLELFMMMEALGISPNFYEVIFFTRNIDTEIYNPCL